MKLSQINKLYISNFLTGLVFWYGIEKLFQRTIGIDAVGVGILTVITIGFGLLLDIPSGMLADKWSRKGMLALSAIALATCSVILGSSHSFTSYIIGYFMYSIYFTFTSGTYQAITYDSLHEQAKASEYSKVNGRAYALFLAGAGVANIMSGFIAAHFGFRAPFYISVIPCLINILIILSLREPVFHKPELKQKALKQLGGALKTISQIHLLSILAIVMSMLSIIEVFKADFGQLYFLRYISTPQLLGLVWAIYAFTWAIGGLIAHRLQNRLTLLIVCATLPVIVMSLVDSWPAIILFNVQAIAAAALVNQIETKIQHATPSHLRASVLSVLSSLGRAVAIPASLVLGWAFRYHGAFYAVRIMGIVAAAVLFFWILSIRQDIINTGSNKHGYEH